MQLDDLMYDGELTVFGSKRYWDTVSSGVTSYMSVRGRSLAYATIHNIDTSSLLDTFTSLYHDSTRSTCTVVAPAAGEHTIDLPCKFLPRGSLFSLLREVQPALRILYVALDVLCSPILMPFQ